MDRMDSAQIQNHTLAAKAVIASHNSHKVFH